MAPKEKMIVHTIIDSVGTLVLTFITMLLPALFTIGIYEHWVDEVKWFIAILLIFEAVALYALIDVEE